MVHSLVVSCYELLAIDPDAEIVALAQPNPVAGKDHVLDSSLRVVMTALVLRGALVPVIDIEASAL
ncbi:hypothetical protein [Labrys neptuniae]